MVLKKIASSFSKTFYYFNRHRQLRKYITQWETNLELDFIMTSPSYLHTRMNKSFSKPCESFWNDVESQNEQVFLRLFTKIS